MYLFFLAASFLAKPKIVSVVGNDFSKQFSKLNKKNIETSGLIVKNGKTFSWGGNISQFQRIRLNSLI